MDEKEDVLEWAGEYSKKKVCAQQVHWLHVSDSPRQQTI